MCLNTVKKTYEHPTKQIKSGWKWFKKSLNGKLMPAYVCGKSFPIGKWYVDPIKFPTFLESEEDCKPYTCGFHIIAGTKKEALKYLAYRCSKWVLRRVKYRKVLAIGEQFCIPVAVAREIYIYPAKISEIT